MKKLKGIIFDLDSTLVDVDLDFNAIKDALGIPHADPILEYIATLEAAKKEKAHEILLSFELAAARNYSLIPDVPEVLQFFKDKDLELAVLTRNCKEAAHIELENLKDFFNPIFSREDHDKCKPEPDGILHTCEMWKAAPEDTIMIGDFLYDLQAGIAAGTKTIWYNNPKYQTRDFSAHADYSITAWSEFLENHQHIFSKLGFYV